MTLLELQTMGVMCRYNYANIVTFGGCLDDFMLVACPDEGAAEQKLLFALSKPKVIERSYFLSDFKRYVLLMVLLMFFIFVFADIRNYFTNSGLYECLGSHSARNATNEYADAKRLASVHKIHSANGNWYLYLRQFI